LPREIACEATIVRAPCDRVIAVKAAQSGEVETTVAQGSE
jgi:hypothetical protein